MWVACRKLLAYNKAQERLALVHCQDQLSDFYPKADVHQIPICIWSAPVCTHRPWFPRLFSSPYSKSPQKHLSSLPSSSSPPPAAWFRAPHLQPWLLKCVPKQLSNGQTSCHDQHMPHATFKPWTQSCYHFLARKSSVAPITLVFNFKSLSIMASNILNHLVLLLVTDLFSSFPLRGCSDLSLTHSFEFSRCGSFPFPLDHRTHIPSCLSSVPCSTPT